MNENTTADKYIKIDLISQIRWIALYNAAAAQYPNAGIGEIINYVNKTIYSNK